MNEMVDATVFFCILVAGLCSLYYVTTKLRPIPAFVIMSILLACSTVYLIITIADTSLFKFKPLFTCVFVILQLAWAGKLIYDSWKEAKEKNSEQNSPADAGH